LDKDVIKKAQNGTYYFRASLGFHPETGKRIQKRESGFKTKKEALTAYAKLVLEKPEEVASRQSNMKFKTYLEEYYLPWYKTTVRETTYENRLNAIKKRFAYFYNIKLNSLKPIHIQKWQVLLSEKYSSHYVRLLQGMLSLALDRAIILGLLADNPSRAVGHVKYVKPKIDFWTKEEFEKVISILFINDFYQHFIFVSLWLLFMTGMRIGEASALQWADIDFDTGLLNIDKSLFYKNADNFHLTDPKTRSSVRKIYLDPTTLDTLKKWQKRQAELFNTDFILSYNAIPTNKHTISKSITRYSKMAGVPRIRIHGLRHSHASLLISMGENPLIIKDRLGHEDIQTTLGTYGHLYPNSNYDVAKKLNGILNCTPAKENLDTAPTNQHTIGYAKNCAKSVQFETIIV